MARPSSPTPEATGGRYCLYRWHGDNPVTFKRYLKHTMEHGHANDRADNFFSVATGIRTSPTPISRRWRRSANGFRHRNHSGAALQAVVNAARAGLAGVLRSLTVAVPFGTPRNRARQPAEHFRGFHLRNCELREGLVRLYGL